MWSCSTSNLNQHLRQDILPDEKGLDLSARVASLHGEFFLQGDYLTTPHDNHGCQHGLSTHRAEFTFEVTQPGMYEIEGEVQATNGNNNSFWVQVDGAPSSGYLWDTGVREHFSWARVRDRSAHQNVALDLAPGPHTVTIFMREDDTRLRRLRLVRTAR